MSLSQYSHLNDDSGGSSSEHLRFNNNNNQQQQQQQNNNDGNFSVRSSLRSIGLSATSKRNNNNNCVSQALKEPLKSPTNEEDDPYFVFREDLYRKLDLVEESLQEYQKLSKQQDTTTATTSSSIPKMLKAKKKQLKRAIRTAESTLNDVKMTISLVESQPDRFSNQIQSSELYDRRALVTTSLDRLERVKEEVVAATAAAAAERTTTTTTTIPVNGPKTASMNTTTTGAIHTNNDTFHNNNNNNNADIENNNYNRGGEDPNGGESSELNQLALIQQQDDTLDELGLAVERVGDMATGIHEEIGYQNKILDEMDDDLADAEEKLGMVMGKLGKFLKTKDKWQLRTIMLLILIVLVLIFLILM